MRRLGRRLFTLCSAASLLLCVVVCVLWVRSYFRWDNLMRADIRPHRSEWHYRLWVADTVDGSLDVMHHVKVFDARLADDRFQQPPGRWFNRTTRPRNGVSRRGWFRWFAYDSTRHPGASAGDARILYMHTTRASVPFWSLAVALAAGGLPSVQFVRRKLRPEPGHCRTCGYDLRASPERCPECGTAAASSATEPERVWVGN